VSKNVLQTGSWEHRKRAEEMAKTAELAAKQTDQAAGKHHIVHFLGLAGNQRFDRDVEAVAAGGQAEVRNDYEESKISEDNRGFQMLAGGSAGGFQQGTGLGRELQGRAAPVNANGQGNSTAGLGMSGGTEVQQEDDVFESYRKRCQQAYKHRPNPLNNPRREYDGYDAGLPQ
jgi:splicing factor 4